MTKNKSKSNFAFSLDDVIGQEAAVKEIRSILAIKQKPEIAQYWGVTPPKGVLLVGEPGTGKTMVVRALLNELADFQLAEIKFAEIASKWVHATTENLHKIFKKVEEASKKKHVIVFVDEIDSLLGDRNADNLHAQRIELVNIFIQWMDGGLYPLDNVTVFGATNNLHMLDKAAIRPGRFDKMVEFKNLEDEDVIKALKVHLGKFSLDSKQLDKTDWKEIRSRIGSESFSGAKIANAVRSIARSKMDEHYNNIIKLDKDSEDLDYFKQEYLPNPISTEDILEHLGVLPKGIVSPLSLEINNKSGEVYAN